MQMKKNTQKLGEGFMNEDKIPAGEYCISTSNRNFEGRINPDVKMNYLASPPLVVAYAIAGTMNIDLNTDPIGVSQDGNKIYLKDNVIVYTLTGDTLWCKEMYWDQTLGKFYTDKEVVVKQHNPITKTYGIGFEANQDLTDIKIFKVQPNSFAIINDSSSIH